MLSLNEIQDLAITAGATDPGEKDLAVAADHWLAAELALLTSEVAMLHEEWKTVPPGTGADRLESLGKVATAHARYVQVLLSRARDKRLSDIGNPSTGSCGCKLIPEAAGAPNADISPD